MKRLFIVILCFSFCKVFSQDTIFLKVHFLYGSRPRKEYAKTEAEWFGGMLGGHAGIEGDSGKILNFLPQGKFHAVAKSKNRHSVYAEHSVAGFYGILGGNPDSVKKAVVYVPVTRQQKNTFDSIENVYLNHVPYDYAFLGMRCGAATYEILAKLDILPAYSYRKTYKKIFYPQKLRKLLFNKAKENNWAIVRQGGSFKRKWERD